MNTNNSNAPLETKFGLPADVKFCKKCVTSNQRPNSAVEYKHTQASKKSTIHFDEEGVCDACRLNERKKRDIDWQLRDKELRELCDKHRKNDGSYDCLVPGSGGKDSFYAAHVLKYKYNMNPLTVTWAPHIYTPWGWDNFQSWIHSGFDNYLLTPNGRVHRLLTRLAVERLLHPFQPFIIGQKACAPKLAALFNIPLIFYGENEAEYGNPSTDMQSAKRSWDYFTSEDKSNVFLSGTSLDELSEEFGVSSADLDAYMPVDPLVMEEKNIEVHYLGYYLKWHPQEAYYYSVEHGGFKPSPERNPGTYSKYSSIDDKMDDFHHYTTFLKFGIGRATHDASQEIRNEEITREEGVALIKKYDGEYPERFAEDVYTYLSINGTEFPVAHNAFEHPRMDKDYFFAIADKFRSPHLWNNENSQWKLRHAVYQK